jgi:hypothetical protein
MNSLSVVNVPSFSQERILGCPSDLVESLGCFKLALTKSIEFSQFGGMHWQMEP